MGMTDKMCFDIAARDGKWIVSVSGAMVLACKDKKTALAAMRAATKLLVRSGEAHCDCGKDCMTDVEDSAMARSA
jgi:hypothetical protein